MMWRLATGIFWWLLNCVKREKRLRVCCLQLEMTVKTSLVLKPVQTSRRVLKKSHLYEASELFS